MCAYAHIFRKRPGCALIGACALIRTNTVSNKNYLSKSFLEKIELDRFTHLLFRTHNVCEKMKKFPNVLEYKDFIFFPGRDQYY